MYNAEIPGVTHVVYPFGAKGDPDDGQEYLRCLEKRCLPTHDPLCLHSAALHSHPLVLSGRSTALNCCDSDA